MLVRFALILFACLTSSLPAIACSCFSASPKTALQKATVVFHGKVGTVEHLNTVEGPDPTTGQMRPEVPEYEDWMVVTFNVAAVWKGGVTSSVKVFSTVRPLQCDGYRFEPSREYLVYADRLPPYLTEVRDRFKGETVYYISVCPWPILPGNLNDATKVLGKPKSSRQ